MTRMNWGPPLKRWDPETSLARPLEPVTRRRAARKETAGPAPAEGSLAWHAHHGFNRLHGWCPACRQVERIAVADLSADHLALAPETLGTALRCPDCGGARSFTVMVERLVRTG